MRPMLALIEILHAKGAGTLGTSIYGVPVATPTDDRGFLTVEETGGSGPTGTHQEPGALRRPSFQIVARKGKVYKDARDLADLAFDALFTVSNRQSLDVFFLWIRAKQEPFNLGLDPSGRPRAAFNVDTECRLL